MEGPEQEDNNTYDTQSANNTCASALDELATNKKKMPFLGNQPPVFLQVLLPPHQETCPKADTRGLESSHLILASLFPYFIAKRMGHITTESALLVVPLRMMKPAPKGILEWYHSTHPSMSTSSGLIGSNNLHATALIASYYIASFLLSFW